MHYVFLNNLYYEEKRLNYLNSWISWQALKRVWQWVIRLYLERQAWSEGDRKEGMKRQMGKQKAKKKQGVWHFRESELFFLFFFPCVWFSERAAVAVNPDWVKRHRPHLSSLSHPQRSHVYLGIRALSARGVHFTSEWLSFCHPLVFPLCIGGR